MYPFFLIKEPYQLDDGNENDEFHAPEMYFCGWRGDCTLLSRQVCDVGRYASSKIVSTLQASKRRNDKKVMSDLLALEGRCSEDDLIE